jgi:triosephosphate isomerase (TIM)
MTSTNHGRRPIIAGNWKLRKNIKESVALIEEIKGRLTVEPKCEIVVAPVFTALTAVRAKLSGSYIKLSAQNVYEERDSDCTGEINASQLQEVGCDFVIIGHSERRHKLRETDNAVYKKIKVALAYNMSVIVCVGETLEERKAGKTLDQIAFQVGSALIGLKPDDLARVVIAYEPVWAIGTGMNAKPSDVEEVHVAIRQQIAKQFNESLANGMRILYGGSVKPDNAESLMGQPDVDGALVGGASLTADSFLGIMKAAGHLQ